MEQKILEKYADDLKKELEKEFKIKLTEREVMLCFNAYTRGAKNYAKFIKKENAKNNK